MPDYLPRALDYSTALRGKHVCATLLSWSRSSSPIALPSSREEST